MTTSPWPHLDAAEAPLSSIWQTPRDSFRALAERSRRSPEAVAVANAVGGALARYLDGAITLREFARMHTPYERFRAVRVWGPEDPRFDAIMPVLDQLIALHKTGKSAPPNVASFLDSIPTATKPGRGKCAVCGVTIIRGAGQALICGPCAASAQQGADEHGAVLRARRDHDLLR